MYIHVYILLVCERILVHDHGRSRSTSSEKGSEDKCTRIECREVDIAGNVDHQIAVDPDSSLDDEILEEVVRAHMRK